MQTAVKHILSAKSGGPATCKKGGGAVGMSDRRMMNSLRAEDDLGAEGGKTPKRYAKGGSVKIKISMWFMSIGRIR
jgi:hypothetical protein